MNRVIDFVKKEIVLIISFVLAIISMFFVPPSERYIDYIDRRTLGLLFCLMTIMAGLNRFGLFKLLAEKLVHKVHTIRGVTVTLVLLCFFISMIITNDVTLITFVPFTIILLEISHQKSKLIYIVTLETVSANLGSMTTPIGNPQNLYLFSNYNMNIDEFIIAIIPYSVLSLVLLVVLSLFVGNESITVEKELNRVKGSKNSFLPIMYGILFILALFSVFKILDYRVLLGVLLIAILSLDRITLIKVDYSLIFTFVFLFIFIGNLGNIEYIHNFLQGIIIGNEVWVGVLSSQIFSNVPASILLSKFTDNGSALLIGVNIGGLGTLIASMASLISFKFLQNENIKISRYIIVFTFMNLVFLGINLLWNVLVSKFFKKVSKLCNLLES